MSQEEIKKEFLRKLELFYRNFGSHWTINDFSNNPTEKRIIKNFLLSLSRKHIIELDKDFEGFEVLDLPSNHDDLI
ncbi:hypothetical protein HX109_08635 [Galbibacter sp. BG1]|uniref:hypothetical protein n=1 Tax=Galbibacter sp. BG1 TaxID=1170699 RepID=UPI0015C1B6CB|nr:hypothetical protein [Galbibacter sp. BG1]QLE01630.1 hypothetical protein HX109_08635 [Galbibacter sp. BG1]